MTDGFDLDFGLDSIPGVGGDINKIETKYKTWEDGNYPVKGIHSFISEDKERHLPIFVPQGDQLVARFKFMLEDGEEGPPFSVTASQMLMLVRAFGGDPTKLSANETSKFLLDAMDMINSSDKVQTVGLTKGSGWVSWVSGMNPPLGNTVFMWEFKGFWNTKQTNPVCFADHEAKGRGNTWNECVAWAKFTIIADAWANPTPYAGYEMNIKVKNPYSGTTAQTNGNLFPATSVGERGGIEMHVRRWLHFLTLFCMPEYATRHWESDPEKSQFGVNEFDNPLAVVNTLALNAKRKVVSAIGQSKSGAPKLNLDDFSLYKGGPIDLDKQAAVASKQPRELLEFVEYIENKTGYPVFEPTAKGSDEINLTPTSEGLKWLRDNLGDPWATLHLPTDEKGRRNIGKLTGSQLAELTTFLKLKFGDSNFETPVVDDDDGIAF